MILLKVLYENQIVHKTQFDHKRVISYSAKKQKHIKHGQSS